MEKRFDSLFYRFIIDDILLFADDIDTYLDILEEFFGLLEAPGLKLSAKKSSLYQKTVKWCGRVISSDGI
ncbi:LOW QUALITY PROTEIN: Retrovirus Polyprotein [Phytophthora megakarya]|uniref:Retrovirus Polyprotein n=1 Tax=Phytophthora megakarya TaxID=4795 RepID=A0A225WUT7_9STRA|nr:LOW QUALITY PROTEIN: Retrovirus Polyprotein [Phytophthora megakarya]